MNPFLEQYFNDVEKAFCTEEITLNSGSLKQILPKLSITSTPPHLMELEHFKNSIAKVEFFPPATKMTFKDGDVVTVVARHGDKFDEEVGIMHCILKKIFGGTGYNSMTRSLIKDAYKREAEKFMKRQKEEAAKEAEAKAKEEARMKEQKRLAREREEKIEIQKEAYIRAMREMKGKK